MDWEKTLAIVAVVIGLPGFFLTFLDQTLTVGIMGLLFGLASMAAAYYASLSTRTPFSISSVIGNLVIHDDTGTHATITKESRIKPNYKYLDHIDFRNIGADGEVTNICWNGNPVEASAIKKLPGGEYEVDIKFRCCPSKP